MRKIIRMNWLPQAFSGTVERKGMKSPDDLRYAGYISIASLTVNNGWPENGPSYPSALTESK
jgi:hypothetical protein